MKIWVDADACPRAIREILFRAAERRDLGLVLVANRPLATPPSSRVTTLEVPKGFDEADHEIIRRLAAGDVVVTADIPLAAEVIAHGGTALDPRGELYTTENVRERLAIRDFMADLRSAGQTTGGPAALGQSERRAFANALDRLLTRELGPPP